MTFPLRAVLAFALLFGGFATVCPRLTEACGLDFWNRIGQETPPANGTQEEALEGVKQSQQRQEMRHIVIQELVEERMKLADAIDHFYELDQIEPEVMNQTRRRFPAESDQMTVGLQVLSHVEAFLYAEPSRREEVARRLKMELVALRTAASSAIH